MKGAGVQLCADFQRGRCMRDNCRYVHDPNSASGAQVCNDFLRGRCMRESCRFLHQAPAMGAAGSGYPPPYQPPPSYQQPPPQSSYGYGGGSSSYASGAAVQKCADFARGRCMRDNCRFVHDTAAGAPRNPSPSHLSCSALLTPPPSASAYMAASYGGYGSSSASLPDAPVCKDFQNGRSVARRYLFTHACSLKPVCCCRCVRGAQCRYKHEMLDAAAAPPAAHMSYMPSAYAAAAPQSPAAIAATSSASAGTPCFYPAPASVVAMVDLRSFLFAVALLLLVLTGTWRAPCNRPNACFPHRLQLR